MPAAVATANECPGVLLHRPICPCEMLPAGLPGLALIKGTAYMVSYHADLPPAPEEPVILGYRLRKEDGTAYDIDAQTGECDCPSGAWRAGPCKHARAVAHFRAAGLLL